MAHIHTHTHEDPSHSRAPRSWLDVMTAVMLGLVAVVIAFSAYSAESKSKDAEKYYNRSDETLSKALHAETAGNQEVSMDEGLFLEYTKDRIERDTVAVAYMQKHLLSKELLLAINWWEKQEPRPLDVFSKENPFYKNPYFVQAGMFETRAEKYLGKAHKADNLTVDYTLVIVLLTIALFLFGITTQFTAIAVRKGLISFGMLIFLLSVAQLVNLQTG